MHDDAYIGRRSGITLNASCMTISGERTEQLDIFCRVTGFASDFLSFIVVEYIRFFHGALQSPFNEYASPVITEYQSSYVTLHRHGIRQSNNSIMGKCLFISTFLLHPHKSHLTFVYIRVGKGFQRHPFPSRGTPAESAEFPSSPSIKSTQIFASKSFVTSL